MNKIFWFYVDMNNYHTGTTVYTFDKQPNEDLDCDDISYDEAVPYSFEIPINYRIYIIDECPNYKIIGYIDAEKEEDCKKIYLKTPNPLLYIFLIMKLKFFVFLTC